MPLRSRLRFCDAEDETAEESVDGSDTTDEEDDDELGTALLDFFSVPSSIPLSDFSSVCCRAPPVAVAVSLAVSIAGLSDCGLGVGDRLVLS